MDEWDALVRVSQAVKSEVARNCEGKPMSGWEAEAIISVARAARRAGIAGEVVRGFRVETGHVLPAYGYKHTGTGNVFVFSDSDPPMFVEGAASLADVHREFSKHMRQKARLSGRTTVETTPAALAAHFCAAGIPDPEGVLAYGVLKAFSACAAAGSAGRAGGAVVVTLESLATRFTVVDAVYRRGAEAYAAWLAEEAGR